MGTSGIRELRQRASELLRRVEAGETIEITDRGRPVAVLAPLPNQRPIERLRVSGELESAALRRYLGRHRPLVSSALARTEVVRALLPLGREAVWRGREVLASVDL